MNEIDSHHLDRPLHTAERQRILAARGWESDRDRTEVLRELLSPHLERIFLWGYSRTRNRDQALDLTRTTLMWVSRTLGDIPDDCSLDAWVFEHLAVESRARLPLVRSELGQAPRLVLSDFPNERYLVDYPETKKLLDAFRAYLGLPSDLHLVSRSGWSRAAEDLYRFMGAQFGEEGAGRPPAQRTARARLLRAIANPRRLFGVAAAAVLVLGVAHLWTENRDLRRQIVSLSAQTAAIDAKPPGGATASEPLHGGTDPGRISLTPANAQIQDDALVLQWNGARDAAFYRVTLCTARMDTLYRRNGVREPHHRIPISEITGFSTESNYLFKVDAMRGMEMIGSTGYMPYPRI